MFTHLNPDGLARNPMFTQVVRAGAAADTIYVGGQNGVSADGSVRKGVGAQTAQALENLQLALAAAGAGLDDVVRWTVLLVDGQPLAEALAAFEETWAGRTNPPAITMAVVAGLANPKFLIEIEATAAVPAPR